MPKKNNLPISNNQPDKRRAKDQPNAPITNYPQYTIKNFGACPACHPNTLGSFPNAASNSNVLGAPTKLNYIGAPFA